MSTERAQNMAGKDENFSITAEELAEFFEIHKEDGVLAQIFEMEYRFPEVMERYGAAEVVRRIKKWRTEQRQHKNEFQRHC